MSQVVHKRTFVHATQIAQVRIRYFTAPTATDDTAVIAAWAVAVLRNVFREGYRYVKAGVMLDDIRPRGLVQGSLFGVAPPEQDLRREKLISVLDHANQKRGGGTMGIGEGGIKEPRGWAMQRGMLSQRYTTNWDELREVT